MEKIKCLNCGEQNDKESKYCEFCGAKLKSAPSTDDMSANAKSETPSIVMYCSAYPNEHIITDSGIGFCPECGASLTDKLTDEAIPEQEPVTTENTSDTYSDCCRNGHIIHDPQLLFCPVCGVSLDEDIDSADAAPTWRCNCGHINSIENSFCVACGFQYKAESNPADISISEKIDETKYRICKNGHQIIDDQLSFCPVCGIAMDDKNAAVTPEAESVIPSTEHKTDADIPDKQPDPTDAENALSSLPTEAGDCLWECSCGTINDGNASLCKNCGQQCDAEKTSDIGISSYEPIPEEPAPETIIVSERTPSESEEKLPEAVSPLSRRCSCGQIVPIDDHFCSYCGNEFSAEPAAPERNDNILSIPKGMRRPTIEDLKKYDNQHQR